MITVISYPLNEINFTAAVPTSVLSQELIQNIYVNISDAPTDDFIEITYNNVVKTLLINDECRYNPLDIAFQNKEGAVQIITMFKSKKESISVTSESFESGAEIGDHQFNTFNVQSRTKFTINSGFMSEDKNEAVKQLLLSEKIWFIEKDNKIPIIISSKSLEFKTRANDRLINYAIDFEYSFNDINNV